MKTIVLVAALAASIASAATATTAVHSAVPRNQAVNGNFANDLNGWQTEGWFASTNVGSVARDAGTGFATTDCVATPCLLTQKLATMAGKKYTIAFNFNPGVDVEAGGGDTLVTFGERTLADFNGGVLGWTAHSFDVVATGAMTALTFAGYQNPAYNGVDSVSVTAVPEPAMWAMMLGGFALVGSALRRRTIAFAA